MKEFICKKDFYIENIKFASTGDHVVLLPDNYTVVNTNGQQKVTQMPEIVKDKEYFAPTFNTIKSAQKEDKVNHPSHYTWLKDLCGVEVIDITRHMDFCLGNAIKYILRAGHKSEEGYSNKQKEIEDLKKALFYINDKITQLQYEVVRKDDKERVSKV